MSKPTPGPWKVIDLTHVYAADLQLVAVAQHCRFAEENARLIAAAHELLEALQDALYIFKFGEDDKTVVAPKWVARAEAAVLKATGVKP